MTAESVALLSAYGVVYGAHVFRGVSGTGSLCVDYLPSGMCSLFCYICFRSCNSTHGVVFPGGSNRAPGF